MHNDYAEKERQAQEQYAAEHPNQNPFAGVVSGNLLADRLLAGEERENLMERIDRQRARMYELTGVAFEMAERDLKALEAELAEVKP